MSETAVERIAAALHAVGWFDSDRPEACTPPAEELAEADPTIAADLTDAAKLRAVAEAALVVVNMKEVLGKVTPGEWQALVRAIREWDRGAG